MKKFLSLVLAFLMLMSIQTVTFAGEITSEGLSIDGWNGWSVASGSAVTTKTNPHTGDEVNRGDMVKVTAGGSASRYFAQWFEGAIELSVDVFGTGTLNFHDSNARSAGLVTLADGLINNIECSYDAENWNTVKLFVMTGTNKAEVYLGDSYVTGIDLDGLVRPTTLTVSANSDLYIDNIKVSELNKTAAYEEGELSTVYESNFASGKDGWAVRDDDDGSATVSTDSEKFGYTVLKFDKVALASGTMRPSLYRSLNNVGNIVFETELYKASGWTGDSRLTLYVRNTNPVANNNAGGREIELLTLTNDGYITIGSDGVSSKQFSEYQYGEDEWFKIKVEVVTENQSVIVYVGNEDGEWTRVNDVPVRIYHNEGVSQNAESYQTFERIGLKYASSRTSVATWYMKNSKISTPRTDTREVTLLEENFDDATTDFVYNDGALTSGTYKGKPLESGVTGGEKSGVGKLWFNYHNSSYKHVGEDVAEEITDFTGVTETGTSSSKISSSHYYTVNFDESIDLKDALGIDVTYDYYDAAVCRYNKSTDTKHGRTYDTLTVNCIKSDGTTVYSHTMQNTSMYSEPASTKYSTTKVKRAWDTASDKRTVYASGNNSTISANGSSKSFATTALTQETLSSITGIKFATSKNIGGLYYIDNLKVVATVPVEDGYIRKGYSAYKTFEDNITRANVSDIELGYVEFTDANSVKGGMPTAGGKVSSVSIVKNADVSANAKLLVGVYSGNALTGCELFDITSEKTYTLTKDLATTADSVVKAFIWDMNALTPIADSREVNKEARTKLVLFGDSLVCDYDPAKSDTRSWGQFLGNHVDTNELEILNYAVAGMTTADYLGTSNYEYTEGRHEKYLDAIDKLREGDYAMISLGSNDSKDEHGLLAGGAFVEDYVNAKSFAANLYKMVSDIEGKGATPILVTPHPRCRYINKVNRSELQVGKYQIMINDIRRLAKEKDIALIDLYEMAIDEYDNVGELVERTVNDVIYYVDSEVVENYVSDLTHLSEKGALNVASLVAEGMAQLDCGIEDFVR